MTSAARHVRPAAATASSIAASRRPRPTLDQAQRRDPTGANDLRNRLSTQLKRRVNDWRKLAYQAIVESDVLGYQYGAVDPTRLRDLADQLDRILRQQALTIMAPSYDNLSMTLRTAYGRGVNKAIGELGSGVPLTPDEQLINQAFNELAIILDTQISSAVTELTEQPEQPSRSRHLLWGAILLPFLFRALARRINSLATTNVTRAYNAGKLDTYEVGGIEEVGVAAETQPHMHVPEPEPPEELQPETGPRPPGQPPEPPTPEPPGPRGPVKLIITVEHTITRPGQSPSQARTAAREHARITPRRPVWYTVQTMGDDKVCAICSSYEGQRYRLDAARRLIPAHPNCRCSVVPLT